MWAVLGSLRVYPASDDARDVPRGTGWALTPPGGEMDRRPVPWRWVHHAGGSIGYPMGPCALAWMAITMPGWTPIYEADARETC